jgi:hypothetical protein
MYNVHQLAVHIFRTLLLVYLLLLLPSNFLTKKPLFSTSLAQTLRYTPVLLTPPAFVQNSANKGVA